MKSSINQLKFISGPNKWSNGSGYLCEVNVVLPQKNVIFQWEIGRYFTDKTDKKEDSMTVPASDECYTKLSSFYPCDSLKNTGAYNSIRCTAFRETKQKSVYGWTKGKQIFSYL